jgi:hypothetical protein
MRDAQHDLVALALERDLDALVALADGDRVLDGSVTSSCSAP